MFLVGGGERLRHACPQLLSRNEAHAHDDEQNTFFNALTHVHISIPCAVGARDVAAAPAFLGRPVQDSARGALGSS